MGNSLSMIVSSLVCITIAFVYHKRARRSYEVPAPRFVPIIGHLIGVITNFDRWHDYVLELSQEAGEKHCIDLGLITFFSPSRRYLLLGLNEKLVEHVLKTNFPAYVKGEYFNEKLSDMLGKGIFNVDGELWRRHRKIASYMFTARHLKDDMTKVFIKNGEIVKKRLQDYAESGKIFDIQDLFFQYTLDSFALIAFGENPNCLLIDDVPFARAFDSVQATSQKRFFSTAWQLSSLLNIGAERDYSKQLKIMNDYAYTVIKHRREMNDKKVPELQDKTDLLTRFIVHAENANKLDGEDEGEKEKQSEPLTDKEMRDIVINFIIAGRDTTACLLSWSIYELTQNPNYAESLFIAIHNKYKETSSYEACGQLDIVQNYLYETLRLHPSVPTDIKTCIKDDILPDGTKIYADDVVIYSPYVMGRSKLLWGDDCQTFRPERWQNEKPSEFKFPHFNAGPRLCLGKRVATLEAGLLFSLIVHNFRVELAGRSKLKGVTYLPTLTLPIKDGLTVRIHKR